MRKNIGNKPWFYPLPVLIIGTYDENGVPDAMNAAYGGLYTSNMIEFSIGHNRKTFKNIQQTKAFTVSFADVEIWRPATMWDLYPATIRRIRWRRPVGQSPAPSL